MTTGKLPPRVVLATHNTGKVAELRALLEGTGCASITASSLGLGAPEETGLTYSANAVLKASVAAARSGLPALADDAGLAVDRLDGAPGIHTARYAADAGGWPRARDRLATQLDLRTGPPARAQLCCALALATPSGRTPMIAFAAVEGTLGWPPNVALPGFAALFAPDHGPLVIAEVLAHRRAAFTSLLARL